MNIHGSYALGVRLGIGFGGIVTFLHAVATAQWLLSAWVLIAVVYALLGAKR